MTNTSRSDAGAPIGAGIAIGAPSLIFISCFRNCYIGGGVVAGLVIGAIVDLLRARSRRAI